jgi:VWFA-related protein
MGAQGERGMLRRAGAFGFAHLVLLLFAFVLSAVPARAQQTTGRVAVVDVDDQNFPTVSLFMDVADANGAPVAGLAPANFVVQEDGSNATVQAVSVDASQPLALLLALDRSTDAATWAAVQGAAAAVINALGENDQVAITTVFEQVQPVQEFTADKDAALAALAGVAPGGQFSAINPAFVDAVGRFNDNLPARRAIILVADAPDNISTVTAADVVAQTAGQGTPIYVVGYGERVQNEPTFAQIATATGGQFFAIGAAQDLQNSLTALLPQLRQGYRIDFVSSVTADSLPHTAQVQVNAPNVSGSASAQFVARPSTIEVTIPGLLPGQPLAGVVNLTAAAVLPGTVSNVEFRVDGVVVGSAPNLETPVAWDTSTLAPGPHQLTVVVTDSVGNQGEASVEVLIPASAPRVDIIGVEYAQFPQITAYVDAFGNNGLPLAGLNAASLTVREDNRPVDASQVAVSVDATQPLHLVLVLDRSVPVAEWAQLRNIANGLVDALRPQDQMAIYTFAASPSLVQTVTGDKNTLKGALATIEAVPPAPPTTPPTPSADNGLHQALLDSTNLATTLPAGRRAVLVLTNSTDNTGQIALPSLVATLENQPVAAHILAFSVDGQSAGTLAAIAQLSGGNSVSVNNVVDLRGALQTLTLLLQQGYRVNFTSALQADDNEHSLTVALAAGGLTAEATSAFIARGRPITVTFPNVVEGSTVSGALNLTAQADAPAPITSVVYRLNGDVLAEVADTSFSIVWNSDTVEPGAYTVVVEVVDAAGNLGTATVNFTVVAPITLVAALAPANSDGDITLGDSVTVNADVEVFRGQARVEFYVDGQLVSTDAQPPYSATFDSTSFGAGNHSILVVARNEDGREANSTLDFVLIAPPEPTPLPTATPASILPAMPTLPALNWWRVFTWIGMIAVGLGALLMVISALGSARRTANEQKLMPMRLSLSNLGNVATGYLLRGEDMAGILNFRFSLNGVVLGLPPVARLTEESSVAQGSAASASVGGGRPAFGGVQLPNLPQGNGEEGADVGGAMDKLEEASLVGRIIADILYSVAMFLPPTLARPLRTVAMQIRRGQMIANRVKHVRRQVGKLNKSEMGQKVVQGTTDAAEQVGRVATADSTRSSMEQGVNFAGGAMAATAAATVAGAKRQVNRLYDLTGQAPAVMRSGNGANGVAAPAGTRQWVYVPPVAPGETVTIDVMVGANARSANGDHHPFRILSRALGEENAQPVVEEGSIRLAKSSPWPALTRYVFATIIVVLAIALIWLLASLL